MGEHKETNSLKLVAFVTKVWITAGSDLTNLSGKSNNCPIFLSWAKYVFKNDLKKKWWEERGYLERVGRSTLSGPSRDAPPNCPLTGNNCSLKRNILSAVSLNSTATLTMAWTRKVCAIWQCVMSSSVPTLASASVRMIANSWRDLDQPPIRAQARVLVTKKWSLMTSSQQVNLSLVTKVKLRILRRGMGTTTRRLRRTGTGRTTRRTRRSGTIENLWKKSAVQVKSRARFDELIWTDFGPILLHWNLAAEVTSQSGDIESDLNRRQKGHSTQYQFNSNFFVA